MKPEKKAKKGNWIVKTRCTVIKEVYVNHCTEEEAREHPFEEHYGGETELEMIDWEVDSVEPND